MVTCPNCGTRNPTDNAYCSKCGFRLPTAAARGAGVAYRRAEQTEPHGGGGQGLLAFGAVLLAGLLFAIGAVALFVSSPPAASPTPPRVADATPTSSLDIFVQPTPTPTVPPTPTLLPSFFLSSPSPLDTPVVTPIPTPTLVTTPTPTPTPTKTPKPTPEPTPANCDLATGTPQRVITLSSERTARTVPANKVWCLTGVSIEPGPNYGPVRLFTGDRILAEANCQPGACEPAYLTLWSPDEIRIREGRTLGDFFVCDANPETPEIEDCATAGIPEGAFIRIGVEIFPAP